MPNTPEINPDQQKLLEKKIADLQSMSGFKGKAETAQAISDLTTQAQKGQLVDPNARATSPVDIRPAPVNIGPPPVDIRPAPINIGLPSVTAGSAVRQETGLQPYTLNNGPLPAVDRSTPSSTGAAGLPDYSKQATGFVNNEKAAALAKGINDSNARKMEALTGPFKAVANAVSNKLNEWDEEQKKIYKGVDTAVKNRNAY